MGRTERIIVYEDDKSEDLSNRFAETHSKKFKKKVKKKKNIFFVWKNWIFQLNVGLKNF